MLTWPLPFGRNAIPAHRLRHRSARPPESHLARSGGAAQSDGIADPWLSSCSRPDVADIKDKMNTCMTDELLQNARSYTESFTAPPLSGKPALRVAVVACMDARLDPRGLLGLRDGDAHVIRNAGGVVTPD